MIYAILTYAEVLFIQFLCQSSLPCSSTYALSLSSFSTFLAFLPLPALTATKQFTSLANAT